MLLCMAKLLFLNIFRINCTGLRNFITWKVYKRKLKSHQKMNESELL